MIVSTGDEVTFDLGDRILILAPHPDDETIATGGVIQKDDGFLQAIGDRCGSIGVSVRLPA